MVNKREIKLICLVLYLLIVGRYSAQCPPNLGNVSILPPVLSVYCQGSNINFQFNSTFPIVSLSWTYSGQLTSGTTVPPSTYKIVGLLSNGVTTAQGQVFVNGRNCNFSIIKPVPYSTLAADAGIDKPINAAQPQVSIGGSPSAINGASPYTYLWTPNSNFAPGSSQTQSNPNVNPTTNVSYLLTVTDASGCTATDQVNVVQTLSYGELKRTLDAGFYQVFGGKLYFSLDGEYNSSSQLKYKIYDAQRSIRADYSNISSPSLPVQVVDNRYLLNLSSSFGFSSSDNNNFFTLEIVNEKNEFFILKFKYVN